MTESAPAPTATPEPPIVARAGRYYRNARYLMVLGILVFAAYFLYDGFVRWPANNEKIATAERELNDPATPQQRKIEVDAQLKNLGPKRSDRDILLQKVLGFGLPVVAIAYAAFFLWRSRGEIRLEDAVLHVPGHPPVPLTGVTRVDDGRWKKKGISDIYYTADGRSGVVRLDDFVYQQTPVDAIHDRVVAARAAAAPEPLPESAEQI